MSYLAAGPELDEEGYVKGLTAEEIMNLPDLPDEEDEETAGLTIGKFVFAKLFAVKWKRHW